MVDVVTEVKYKSGKKIVINKESFSESKIINAKTIITAKKLMIDYINEQYNIEESWRVITVKSIKINSILDVNDPIVKTDVKTMRMKQLGSDILDYDYVKEFKDFLQTDQEFGTCVIDNLVGMYEKTLKITRDQLINIYY